MHTGGKYHPSYRFSQHAQMLRNVVAGAATLPSPWRRATKERKNTRRNSPMRRNRAGESIRKSEACSFGDYRRKFGTIFTPSSSPLQDSGSVRGRPAVPTSSRSGLRRTASLCSALVVELISRLAIHGCVTSYFASRIPKQCSTSYPPFPPIPSQKYAT